MLEKAKNLLILYINIFCDSYIKDQCVAAINNDLFYTDDNHLTLEGNNLLIQKLLKFIND